MKTKTGRRFPLGWIGATPNAQQVIPPDEVARALARHAACDWGDLDPEDWQENERALREGSRLFSVYHTAGGVKFWVITEADRSATTVLLPEDY